MILILQQVVSQGFGHSAPVVYKTEANPDSTKVRISHPIPVQDTTSLHIPSAQNHP